MLLRRGHEADWLTALGEKDNLRGALVAEAVKAVRILLPVVGRTAVLAVRLALAVLLERFAVLLLGAEGDTVDIIHRVTIIAAIMMLGVHFVREIGSAVEEYHEG